MRKAEKTGASKKKKARRRHKHCPICKEIVPMSVIREAEDEDDFYWLMCPSCDSKFALTRQQYHKGKQPDISPVEADRAKIYRTTQIYLIGQLIYHRKLDDLGVVTDKTSPPDSVDCSGVIVVSFVELGRKMLIEGYATA
jgi:hypothetical protein